MEKKQETKKVMTFEEKTNLLGKLAQDMASENVDLTIAMLEFVKQNILLDYVVAVREKIKEEQDKVTETDTADKQEEEDVEDTKEPEQDEVDWE